MEKDYEIRKIWQIKRGSYITSLPKDWVEKYKEKEIAVSIETDDTIRLIPKSYLSKHREVTIDLDLYKDSRIIEYQILTYYMQGAEKITVTSKESIDINLKRKLKDLLNELIGADITDERANTLTFEILIKVDDYKINETIEKINKFIDDIHKDTITAINNLNKQLATEISERVKDGIKKYRLIIRQIAMASYNPILARKIGINHTKELIVYGLVASHLNRIIYHISSVNNHLLKINKEDIVAKDYVLKMSDIAYNMRNEAINSFINRKFESAVDIIRNMNIQKTLEEELLNYLFTGKIGVSEAIGYSMIGREFRRVSGYAVGIADALANLIFTP